MRVAFRVDSSAAMGSGHLMRCVTLATVLKERGVEVLFLSGDHEGNLNAWLQDKGFALCVITKAIDSAQSNGSLSTDADQTAHAIGLERPEWLVVDHYGIDIDWERRVRPCVERLMVIDDGTGRYHDCDILLDQNYSEKDAARYAGLVPRSCSMMLGTSYALLRKDFGELRRKIQRLPRMENVLVFFTAGNDQGETLKALEGLVLYGRATQVDVVIGSANPYIDAIKSRCDELSWGYHCQVDYMPSLIAEADLVIGAGGSSNWERCALGAPALVTILADNQAAIAAALDAAGAVRNLGWYTALQSRDYADALSALDVSDLAEMSAKAMKMVDGLGAIRVTDALLIGAKNR